MKTTSNRISYIDVFRGFGILMMVMGHVGFGDIFQHWIHAFHMPMFFFIAGYLYKSRPFKTTLVKRIKGLLLPYFIVGGNLILLTAAFGQGELSTQFYHLVWINTRTLVFAGALWFLTALFFADVLFLLLVRIKNTMVFVLLSLACILFGAYCKQWLPFTLPWGLSAALSVKG